jgi:transcriptional regulator with XRE-family HTH domain
MQQLTEMHAEWGRRVRRLRRDKELTATSVAREVGISSTHLHRIEGGAPSSDEVRLRIARALGVDPGEIFNYDLTDAS